MNNVLGRNLCSKMMEFIRQSRSVANSVQMCVQQLHLTCRCLHTPPVQEGKQGHKARLIKKYVAAAYPYR